MTDIVERLRHHADDKTQWGWRVNGPVLHEAADEIEKLQKWLKSTQDAFDASFRDNEQLRVKNDYLRSALFYIGQISIQRTVQHVVEAALKTEEVPNLETDEVTDD